MAHQMSPPQRPGFGNPYYQQPAHSPPGIALPPAKRPRLSPGAGSPQSPASGFPESPYGPFSASSMGPGSPSSFNTPQPHAMSPPLGMMGPPPKPTPEQKAAKEKEEKEKVTDISDISDAMWGSGVDLREEENYLSSTSRAIYGSHSSYDQPNNQGGLQLLTQGLQPGQLPGSGPVSQSISTMENIQRDLDRKHHEAALRYAKENEHHLRNPFLLGNSLRFKMRQIAVDQGVKLDLKGLYDPPRQQQQPPQTPQNVTGVVARGPNGVALGNLQASGVAAAQHAILEEGARYADILSLVSLAANERLRGLLDEAFTISRGRQLGSDGVVPPDLQDLATGKSRRSASVKAESVTNSSWDRVEDGGDAQQTISFTAALTSHLSTLAVSEHSAESQRIKRRAARAARIKAASTDANVTTSADGSAPGTPAPTTPGPLTTSASDSPMPSSGAPPAKPLTKKERERAAKAGQTEEVLHANANVTAAMQLGFGKKAKRYSWMTGGAAPPTNPYANSAPPSRSATAAPPSVKAERGSAGGPPSAGHTKKTLGRERKFGDWRENGPSGRGIQMRDLAAVLERDGRTPKTLERAWLRLESEGAATTAAANAS